MALYNQSIFNKLNRRKEPTQLDQGEYALMINGRVRNGGVEPVKLPLEISSLPAGRIQGIYGFDRYLLVFVEGRAYFRDYLISTQVFYEVQGFQMSADAPVIYACAVPASTVNQKRVPNLNDDDVVLSSGPVTLTTSVGSSPACVLCQDGTTQPFVIFTDGTARATAAYTDWSDDNREYVPVGKQMFYSADGILYLVAQDSNGQYTLILHSVSGRPLDYMVIVDADGNKLSEEDGRAQNVAYSVDYAEVTAMSGIGANDGAFFIATFKQSYLVFPDFTRLIYGEPKFRNQPLFSTGPLNNFSLVDLLGDQALIDFTGIKSFNSILQTRNEGRNTPFSADIQPLFGNIIQTVTAASEFDDYGLFGVTTKYGPAILVWDSILPQPAFVSMDLYPGVRPIKQFATIKTLATRSVFFITDDNKLYEAFKGDTAKVRLYVGEFAADKAACAIKPEVLTLTFVDVVESGTVYATSFLDSAKQNQLSESVNQVDIVQSSVLSEPFGETEVDQVRMPSFDLSTLQASFKVGFYVEWNFRAKLLSATFNATEVMDINSHKEQAREYNATKTFLEAVPAPVIVPPFNFGPMLPNSALPVLAPINLNAVASGFSVALSWNLVSVGQTLRVYRTLTSISSFQLLTTIDGSNVSYIDDTVGEGSTYSYVVTVVMDGVESSYSNTAIVNIVPAAPSSLTTSAVTSSTLLLGWINNSSNGQSLLIGRSVLSTGPFTTIATLEGGDSSYADSGLSAATTYYYNVTVVSNNGLMATSALCTVTTINNVPVAPVITSVTGVSSSSNRIEWTISQSENIIGFKIYRATVSGGPYTLIATQPSNSFVFDIGLSALTKYFYIVKSYNTAADSIASNEMSATTWSNTIVPNPMTGAIITISLEAGTYDFAFVDGAIGVDGGTNPPSFTGWMVNDPTFVNTLGVGYRITFNSGVTTQYFPAHGKFLGTNGFANAVAANVGEKIRFTTTAGNFTVQLYDTIYIDNKVGIPSATFQIRKIS